MALMALPDWAAPASVKRLKSIAFVTGVGFATILVTYLLTLTLGEDLVVGGAYRSPRWAVVLHLVTVVPGVILGGAMLAQRKGGRRHAIMGWTWMGLMATTALASFWIRSPTGELSAIHLFSIAMIIALPISVWRIKSRDIRAHRRIQLSLYIGLLVAGAFALAPDRELGLLVGTRLTAR